MNIPTAVNASLCSFRNNHTQIPFSPIAQPSWYVDRDVKIPVTTPYRSSISSTSQDIHHYLVISFISIGVLIPIIGTGLFLSCIKNLIFSNDEFLQFLYATGRQPIRRRPGRLGRTSGAAGVTDLSNRTGLARAERPTKGKQVRFRRLTTA